VFTSTKYDENDLEKPPVTYPPALKINVNTSPSNSSKFVTISKDRDANGGRKYIEMCRSTIPRSCYIIPCISFQWVFRRKVKEPIFYAFSTNVSIYHAIIEQTSNSDLFEQDKLVIVT
jgi:hypothetical protein